MVHQGRGRIARLLRRLASEHTTPGRTAVAVAVGIVVGTSPFFGFHLPICLVLATVLGLNRAITYLAANISVPWVAPFLVFASVQVGALVVDGRFLPLQLETLNGLDPWSFGGRWLLGSLLFGITLAVPAGLATYLGMRTFRRRHPLPDDPHTACLESTALYYKEVGRFAFGYVKGKLTSDPVYRQLASRAPLPAPVVDVGCGRGQSLILLAEVQGELSGRGIDWDGAKLTQARRAASSLRGLQFEAGDIRTCALPKAGTVLMLDVLHYNPQAVQDDMLRRAAAALLPGGRLYVREVDLAQRWRARLTIWQEKLGCLLALNKGATLCFRPAAELVQVLESAGLTASMVPSWGSTPFANVLIEAQRAGEKSL